MLDGSFLNEVYRTTNETINPASRIILKSTPVVIEETPPQMQQYLRKEEITKTNNTIVKNSEQYNDGFLDHMIMKKRDMIKTIVLVLTIVVALSLHSFFIYWLKASILTKKITIKYELLIRLLYPILILLIIWFIKALIL